jgi:hypothetical protein
MSGMDWIPSILTTSLFAGILWLCRNLIITRLTNAVKHEYDKKIEQLKTEFRKTEEAFKADLKRKEAQIEALRSGALYGIANRQYAIFQRQLVAIEQLWNAVISLSPAKSISALMAVIKFETAAKEAANNPRLREMFAMMDNLDMNIFSNNHAWKARPFVSQLAWAYYSAYQAILSHAVLRLQMLKNGLDMVEVIDTKSVVKLVKVALPHQAEYIEKYGPSAFHYLLDELESNLLLSFKLMLDGKELDKETLEKAAAIIKEAEKLIDSSKSNSSMA